MRVFFDIFNEKKLIIWINYIYKLQLLQEKMMHMNLFKNFWIIIHQLMVQEVFIGTLIKKKIIMRMVRKIRRRLLRI